MTITRKIRACVLACMLLLTLAIGALVQVGTARSLRIASRHAVADAGAGLEALERADVARLDAALVALASNPALVEAYRARDRERFLRLARPVLEGLRQAHDVTHLSVHDLARVNFARVHAPERSGGLVERTTLAQAALTGQRAAGKELGATAFALRVVVPWRVGGEVIGYLEAAEELGHLLARLKEQTGDDYALLVEKRFVDEAGWKAAYGERKPWGTGGLLVVQSTAGLPVVPPGHLEEALAEGAPFVVPGADGRTRARGFFPVRDAAGRRVGAVVVDHDLSALSGALEKERAGVLLTLAGAGAVMALFLPWLVQRLVFVRLRRLAEAMEAQGARLAGGDYAEAAPAPAPPADEIGRFETFVATFLAGVGRHLPAVRRGGR
jgi:HAMP domain-containing protein